MSRLSPESEAWLVQWLEKLAVFSKGECDECLHCGKKLKSLAKHGPCVYGYPCGCRQYQGSIPPNWKAGSYLKNCYTFQGENNDRPHN